MLSGIGAPGREKSYWVTLSGGCLCLGPLQESLLPFRADVRETEIGTQLPGLLDKPRRTRVHPAKHQA